MRYAALCGFLAAVVGLAGAATAARAGGTVAVDTARGMTEMPVLTGDPGQKMTHDDKIAFVWGMGHVVTVEEHVIQKHPELRRVGFRCQARGGLRGIPMDYRHRR